MGKLLSGKTAVVTGAGKRSGIGYAVACKLAAEGANVVIADLGRDADPELAVKTGVESEMTDIAKEVARTHGIDTMAVNLDVTRADSIAAMVQAIGKRFETIDILVNNAGASFGVPNAVHTYDETAWMKTIDVNLHGVFRVSRALLPMMILNGGAIVNTASRAGKVPALFNGAYAVAKAGVIMLTKVMAMELAGNGVRVNAVCPGQIATDLEKWRFGLEAQFFDSTIEEREKEMCKTIPLGRIGSPDEVGDLVVFLASDRAAYMTGQAINITGGQLMEL
ncbi:putative oxidoreductase YxbG [Desulfosarcina alkanivorans]|uniref:Putative oxidoreductase YxbG n=1 Tax=Desulfosarcina alkanivorans TaxID=571177 RepID=A0A5K7YF74_9BACT|nr:SDR family NAD(P)-dependent oxidoreductase [Desulfosarcina alkanivorans]BBO68162.1 putative oxidoreductase YxbG [Desulfosarcina alkanivorans]